MDSKSTTTNNKQEMVICSACENQILITEQICIFCGNVLEKKVEIQQIEDISDAEKAMKEQIKKNIQFEKSRTLERVKDNRKGIYSLVTIGHVGFGKSTILGSMVYRCGGIDNRTINKFEKQSQQLGKSTYKYAWVFDKTVNERERSLTIQLTTWKMETFKNSITLIDAPGHPNFAKTLIRGIAMADAALFTVSAIDQQFKEGFSSNGLTREHSILAYALGIKQLIVCINKMDHKSVSYSQQKYLKIKANVSEWLQKVGYQSNRCHFVPISAWQGQNIMTKEQKKMNWYKGPTLVEALDLIQIPRRFSQKPLRIPVHDVYKIGGIGTVVVGKVQTGTLKQGTQVCLSSKRGSTNAKTIQSHYEYVIEGQAGMYIGIHMKNMSKNDIKRGDILGTVQHPPLLVNEFIAQIVVLKHPSSIKVGYTPIVYCHASHSACKVHQIIGTIDKKTGKMIEKSPKFIKNGDTALLVMRPLFPFCLQTFRDFINLGRIVIRDMRDTIAVGIVKQITEKH